MHTSIIGHTQVLSFFDRVIAHGRLSHAYCLVGPSHIGKRTIAETIAARLLHIPSERLNTSPDYRVIEQKINEKTGKTQKDIDIDQIRAVTQIVSRHAFLGGYTVLLIDHASRMNQSSANAFLKTLEEPRQNTVFFLITENEEDLPLTIRSRCQLIYFYPVPLHEIQKWLEDKGIRSEEAERYARLSNGLPGRVIEWISNKQIFDAFCAEIERFISLFGQSFAEKIARVEELFGDTDDHVAHRQSLQETLAIWAGVARNIFFEKNTQNSLFLTREQFFTIEQLIRDAVFHIERNIHPRLLIEHILLSIP